MAMSLCERLSRSPERDPSLKPCPFCGGAAEIEFWHGGKPSKRMVSCSNGNETCEVAPQVTGETKREAIEKWNQRAPA